MFENTGSGSIQNPADDPAQPKKSRREEKTGQKLEPISDENRAKLAEVLEQLRGPKLEVANTWEEFVDQLMEAFANAPGIDELGERYLSSAAGVNIAESGPKHGEVFLANLDLFEEVFDIIDQEVFRGFKAMYFEHESHHANVLKQRGIKYYLKINIALNNKKMIGEDVHYEGIAVLPAIVPVFPEDMPDLEKLQHMRDATLAVGEEELSPGDKRLLEFIDQKMKELQES